MKIRTANIVQITLLLIFLAFTIAGAYLVNVVFTVTPFTFFPSFILHINVGVFIFAVALIFLALIAIVHRRRRK